MIPTKEQIEEKLRKSNDVAEAARELEVGQKYLKRLIARYGLNGKARNDISKAQLETAIEEGMGIRQMALKFNSSNTSIHRLMKKYGLKTQIQNGWDKRRQTYIDLLKEGLSNEEIANRLGVSYKTVNDYICNHNLKSYRKKKPNVFAGLNDGDKQTMLCKNLADSKTKRKCLYGGRCGNSDCCDYLLITGKRREYDKEKPEICYCFVYVSEAEKRKIMAQRQKQARDITVV